MRCFTLVVLSLASWSSIAAPEQFSSASQLMDNYQDFRDYQSHPGFKVINENPLHIQVSPSVFDNSSSTEIKTAIEKASVYATYRVLYQTPVSGLKITVLPLSINMNTHDIKYLDNKKITFSVSKEQAIKLAKKYGGITDSDDVITPSGDWAARFQNCCYLDSGKPGVSVFAKELINHK